MTKNNSNKDEIDHPMRAKVLMGNNIEHYFETDVVEVRHWGSNCIDLMTDY